MTTAQLPLFTVIDGRRHDLPPKWDGRRVVWGPWQEWHSTMRFHADDMGACEQCGSLAPPVVSAGMVHPYSGETWDVYQERRLPSGRTYERSTTVPAWPVLHLHASRCPDCRHDIVHDEHTRENWDLGREDYGDDGSSSP